MNGYVVRFLLTLLLLGLLASLAQAAPLRARPGSFLAYCVTSPEDIASQVRSNPVVAARYGRHFGIPPEMVSDYFRRNLKLTTLKKARVLPVYFVSAGGTIKSRMRVLPAGTPVFALPDGQLVLEAACGNPISKSLHRPPIVKHAPVVQVIPPSASVMPEPVAVAVMPPPAPVEQFLAQPVLPAPPPSLVRYLAPLLGGLFIAHTSDSPPDQVIPELPAPVLSGLGGVMLMAAGRLGGRLRRRRGE